MNPSPIAALVAAVLPVVVLGLAGCGTARLPAPSPAAAMAPNPFPFDDRPAGLPLAGPLYFETDTDTLTVESVTMLSRIGGYMQVRRDAQLVITGNADERGDPAYNLALGERRAQAAREYLTRMGIDGARVRAVSLGEEVPVVDGHDEPAWAWNRRDEFQFVLPGAAQASLYRPIALPMGP